MGVFSWVPRTRNILEGNGSIFLSASYQRHTRRQWEYFPDGLVPDNYWKEVGLLSPLPDRDVNSEILQGNKGNSVWLPHGVSWLARGSEYPANHTGSPYDEKYVYTLKAVLMRKTTPKSNIQNWCKQSYNTKRPLSQKRLHSRIKQLESLQRSNPTQKIRLIRGRDSMEGSRFPLSVPHRNNRERKMRVFS